MTDLPLVSVVIPARNEVLDLPECIAAVAAQDYEGPIEVLIIDGASTDGTAAVAQDLLERYHLHGQVLSNRTGTTPSNLNVGLRAAMGDYVCRVDARSLIPPSYVRTCVQVLQNQPEVTVVGGRQVAVHRDRRSLTSAGIVRALNNRYAMGMSRYRLARSSGPSDTVYLGAFRRRQLLDERGWDERLTTNQDFDLNRRMARHGIVWFESNLDVGYLPRPDLASLFTQYRRFGQAKATYWQLTGDRPQPRQIALLSAPVVGLAGLSLTTSLLARRLRERLLLGAAGVIGSVLVIDHLGNSDQASLRERLASGAAIVAVAAGWWSGAVQKLISRPQEGS